MNGRDLRNSILQLAMQGKLVPQDPNDEPASELLKRIRAEKARLVSEGKIRNEESLSPITEDEMSFDIPENWAWIHFSEIISLTSGQDLKPHEYNETHSGIPYITGASNIKNGGVIINRWTNVPRAIAKRDDLLFSCKGTVGEMAFLQEELVHIARQIMGITIIGTINRNYVQFFLDTSVFGLKVAAKSMIPGIGRDDILKLSFPLPPIAEQERIVSKIDELLPHIAEYGVAEKRRTALNAEFPDKLRKSILQHAVQGRLSERDPDDEPASELLKRVRTEKAQLIADGKIKKETPPMIISEDEIPFDIPETWEWVRLGEICRKIGAGSTPKGGSNVYVSQGIKFIREQNVHDDGLRLDNVVYIDDKTNAAKKGSQVFARDILMNITGGSIGRNALVADDFDIANVNQHVLILRMVDNNLRYFIHYCLCSPVVLNQMFSKQSGDKPGLSATKVNSFLIPLPPLAEQQRIVARVDELLAMCDGLK